MKRILLILAAMFVATFSVFGQDYLAQGDALFDVGKYDEAKAKYNTWKMNGSTRLDYADNRIGQCDECAGLLKIADFLWNDGQQAKALEQYREVLKINSNDPTALARVGNTAATQPSNAARHPAEPEMVFVEGGTFWMGSTEAGAEYNEAPIHQVTLSGFHIGKYEITQGQWRALMGTTVAQQRDKESSSWPLYGVGDNYPIYYVSWDEAQEFVRRLNATTGKRYALPTEAQWEFAARGGNRSQSYTYSGGNDIDGVAWYSDNSGYSTQPIGGKSPNELGIYDMSGNVYEWCADWFGLYPAGAQTDPVSFSSGSARIGRGGSWASVVQFCRSAYRFNRTPGYRNSNLGFRLVLLP